MNYNSFGFSYTGSCSCDGRQTEKYKNGQWQLRHRPKHGTFKFKKNGQTVTDWMSEEKAEEFIKTKVLCDSLEKQN